MQMGWMDRYRYANLYLPHDFSMSDNAKVFALSTGIISIAAIVLANVSLISNWTCPTFAVLALTATRQDTKHNNSTLSL